MSASIDLVERLYRRLVVAAREMYPDEPAPLTVADLYQHLIPYRGVRAELGVLELAQYEHALLRLLAGEGGFLRLLDEGARQELAAELAAPNPILGIYRDYAGLGVELLEPVEEDAAPGPERLAGALEDEYARIDEPPHPVSWYEVAESGGTAPPSPDYPAPMPAPADATRVASRPNPPGEEQVRATPAWDTAVTGSEAGEAADGYSSAALQDERCVFCAQPLPDVEGLLFCPHCGADQSAVPCERCGTPILESWNFCVRCGSRRPSPATAP